MSGAAHLIEGKASHDGREGLDGLWRQPKGDALEGDGHDRVLGAGRANLGLRVAMTPKQRPLALGQRILDLDPLQPHRSQTRVDLRLDVRLAPLLVPLRPLRLVLRPLHHLAMDRLLSVLLVLRPSELQGTRVDARASLPCPPCSCRRECIAPTRARGCSRFAG